jgi:hypothetical protein
MPGELDLLKRVGKHIAEKPGFPLGQNLRKAVIEAAGDLDGVEHVDESEACPIEGTGSLIRISEAAPVSADGEIALKLIAPGQGSSGYYPAETLQRDGPKVARKGLHMYWDHPTRSEESERPERSLRDLAAVLTSDGQYDAQGPDGPGVYAKAKVFEQYRGPLSALAGDIGVSIRGMGSAVEREVEGKKRTVVETLTGLDSVDFVTKPGAGGRIVQLFEAARSGASAKPADSPPVIPDPEVTAEEVRMDEKALQEAQDRVKALETKLAEAQAKDAATAARLNRIEARGIVETAVAAAGLPEKVAARIVAESTENLPMTDAGEVDAAALRESVKARIAAAYEIAESFGARVVVTGAGGTAEPETAAALSKQLAESSAKRLGVSIDTANAAWGVI